MRSDWKWDARLEAAVEVGVVLSALALLQGSIWARPTWGVWWDWDPRLTTTAVLLFAFGGILALRQFVDDPVKRATWSAVATIIAYVDVPIVYFSVRWWNSLHQMQSTPETVSRAFHWPLRINAFGVLFLMIGPHRAARAHRLPAPRDGARAAACARGGRRGGRVMSGVIQGGWEFVIAAYRVSAAILLGYAFSVLRRYRRERARRDGR